MIAVKPTFKVAGDSPDGIQAKSAWIYAVSHNRVIWQAGYLVGSPWAEAFAVYEKLPGFGVTEQTFVLAKFDGTVHEIFIGVPAKFPPSFAEVVKSHLIL